MSEKFQAAVVGVNFRGADAKEVVKSLSVGDNLALAREPNNPYDANAIRVLYPEYDMTWIGYIEKEVAEEVAPLLDSSRACICKILDFHSTIRPYVEIEFPD